MNEALETAKLSCGIPGMSVAILYKGEIIYAKGFGKRNESGDPFTKETVMPIASVTKAFTSTTIGELVAEGKMDWDKTPVSRYLPEFELQDPILTSRLTMADLLSHRTGFPDIDIAWFRNATPRRDLIKRMKHVKMETKLGSDALYNNVMYAVAGEAAANVAGVSYEKLVVDKVLDPLGLTNTGFGPMEMKQRQNYAMPYGAASLDDAKKGLYELGYLDEVYAADSPAGDMYSNVLDLVRWGRVIIKHGELDGKQVLNKQSVQETLNGYTFMNKKRRGPEFAPVQSYGLGWCLDSYKGQIIYRHNGSVPGYRSELALVPNSDLVIACLANIDAALLTNISYHVLDEILDLPKTQDWITSEFVKDTLRIYEDYANIAKGDLPERIENRPPAHGLGAYVGDYSHPVYGNISIRLEEELLFFKMRTFDNEMEHYHFDSFKAFLHDFATKLTILVNFQTGQDGKVEGFKVDFDHGPLEFRRE
ncbi:hypothetical protein BGZ80_000899 [Entomortierella chlamydospora]|uniref:Penicillin-binding protein n=1 Tax=Entomortierella chlamydospora TaxID=101097 RepID=A0A9P6N4A7_9FUNG|nr:hypothetical protein BGZ80_000899 [Entomortierella chlamydospora]